MNRIGLSSVYKANAAGLLAGNSSRTERGSPSGRQLSGVECRRTEPSKLAIRLQTRQMRCWALSPTQRSSRDGETVGLMRRMTMS